MPSLSLGLVLGEEQVSLAQIPQGWQGGPGSLTQIFQVSKAQTRGDKRSPTCGCVQEEGVTACVAEMGTAVP